MSEPVKPTKEQVLALYKGIGKTPKQLASLEFETEYTPLEGYIAELKTEPEIFKVGDKVNKYFVYKVTASKDSTNEIGTLSVSRPFDSEVLEKDYQIVNNPESPNKDKAMLKGHRLTNTSKFGKSRAEQIGNLVGCYYTAERVKGRVIDEYGAKQFVPAPLNAEKKRVPTPENLEKLWKNTVISEKLFKMLSIEPA